MITVIYTEGGGVLLVWEFVLHHHRVLLDCISVWLQSNHWAQSTAFKISGSWPSCQVQSPAQTLESKFDHEWPFGFQILVILQLMAFADPYLASYHFQCLSYFWIGEACSHSHELLNPYFPVSKLGRFPDTQEDMWTEKNQARKGVQQSTQPCHLSSQPVLKGLPSLFLVLSPS